MAKKFNLGDYLKTEDVSKMDTGAEQIVYIDLDRIDPDPSNFYSLDGIDELAGNIELIGLQQPLRVRPEGDRFTVISGHRRRAACMLIRDGSSEQFSRGVPCIVEYGEATPAMRELRLIYANSSTRVLSPAELSKQAERVQELLYELKRQGVEFPGRMREHVAAACRVSESKLARLGAIRKNLREPMLGMFDKGRLNESVAYRISQETPETQERIWKDQGDVLHNLTADGISSYLAHLRFLDSQKAAAAEDRAVEDAGPYRSTFDADEYIAQRAEEDRQYFEMLEQLVDKFLPGLYNVNARHTCIDLLKSGYRNCGGLFGGRSLYYEGSGRGLTLHDFNGSDSYILRTWTDVYDMLCAIALNRAAINIGRTDPEDEEGEDGPDMSRMDTSEPEWQTGDPPRIGRYFCRVDMGDSKPHENRCWWGDDGWSYYGSNLKANGWKVVGWWPLPKEG